MKKAALAGGSLLSGATLPFLGGRPLLGLAASSRAAAKSTTLPECAGAGSSLLGASECACSFLALGASGAAGSSTSAWVTASAGSGTASPISKSAACPSCSSMTASASVSAGSGASSSGTAVTSTVGAGASVGGATSEIFFLSSAICKPPFRGMKKASPQTGRMEVTSLHGVRRRLKESNVSLQREGHPITFSKYHFQLFSTVFAFRGNSEYCKKYVRSGKTEFFYSAKAIDLIVSQIQADPTTVISNLQAQRNKCTKN